MRALLTIAVVFGSLIVYGQNQPDQSGATKAQQPSTPQRYSVNLIDNVGASSSLVIYSGKTSNAKAVTWDDPVAVDGRVMRVRDLWLLASAFSSSSSQEQNPHIQGKHNPEGSAPTAQPPKANQH
jgi:hypothetical protein